MTGQKKQRTFLNQVSFMMAHSSIRQHAGALDVALENFPLQRLLTAAGGKAIERSRVDGLEVAAARAALSEIRALTKIATGVGERTSRPFLFRDVLPILTRALAFQNGEWSVRQATVRALGEIWGDHQVVPLLGYILDTEPDLVVKRAAALELSSIEGVESMSALFGGLSAHDDKLKDIVTSTFQNRPNRRYAVPVLENRLADPDPALRRSAAEILDAIEWKPKIDELRGWYLVAKRDWDAVAAEGDICISPLENALRGRDAKIRAKAADALDVLEWKPTQFAMRGWYAVARQRWGLAVGLKLSATAALINAVDDNEAAIEAAASDALVEIGADAIPSLATAIADCDGARLARRGAVIVGRIARGGGGGSNPLAHRAFAEAVPALTNAIIDRHGKVVLAVAQALGDIADRILCGPPALTTASADLSSQMLFDPAIDALRDASRGQHTVVREGLETVYARIIRAKKTAAQNLTQSKKTVRVRK